MATDHSERPDFGPRGFLPERAARRARKIVLRGQMGLGWPLAAVVAAALVVTAGAWFLLSMGRPPAAPFTAVAPLGSLPADGAAVIAGTDDVLVIRAGGPARAYAAPPGVAVSWCPLSRRLESSDGRVWTTEGQLIGGDGESLRPLPTTVYDGDVYVDATAGLPVPAADPRGETPACRQGLDRRGG